MLLAPLRILLRGAGQVVFCNNAATGLIVLAAFYAGGTVTGLAATIGLISSTVTAYACRFCKADIDAGLYGFNGVLAGACLSIFIKHTPQLWLYIVLASILSSLIWAVLTRMLRIFSMPAATSPFVLISWIFLVTIYAFDNNARGPALPLASMQSAVMDIGATPLEAWFTALARGIGQVIFSDNTLAGGMLLIGIAITTLRGALMVIGGAFIGVVVPALLGVHASTIEAGLYGFNPVLVMIAVGWVFLEPSAKSALLAILGRHSGRAMPDRINQSAVPPGSSGSGITLYCDPVDSAIYRKQIQNLVFAGEDGGNRIAVSKKSQQLENRRKSQWSGLN